MAFQNVESPNFGKWHLDVTPMVNHEKYYKGGRWWLPPSLGYDESCESVYARGSFMHQKCSNHALTNVLFRLCRFVWIIDLLATRPNPHPKAPTCPFTLEVLWAKERTSTLSSSIIFIFKLAFESFKECEGVSRSKLDWDLASMVGSNQYK
jgi:hypothetical protein